MKQFLIDFFKVGPGFRKKAIIVTTGVVFQGFFLSFLIELALGTDPATFMNKSVAENVMHMTFGNWQLIMNILMLAFVLITTRLKNVGLGTIVNMVLIGYIADFCCYLWHLLIPAHYFTDMASRAIIFAITLFGFVVAASVYMNSRMGLSPYDAIPSIISSWLPKVPFTIIRILWDYGVIGIGCLAGGIPPIGTLIMAIALGPTITAVGKIMNKYIDFE